MTPRVSVVCLTLATFLALGAMTSGQVTVKGDAKGWEAIKAAWRKLPTLKTYRIKIASEEMSGTMTVVAPDRMQMAMAAEGTTSESITVGQETRFRQGRERDPELAERNFGALRGTPYAELGFDPFALGYTPPGGESWEVIHARVGRVWTRVDAAARAAGGPIAVVTHGLVCHSVVTRIARLGPGLTLDGLRWRNSSVTVLEGAGGWRVTLLDDVAHLAELSEGGAA